MNQPSGNFEAAQRGPCAPADASAHRPVPPASLHAVRPSEVLEPSKSNDLPEGFVTEGPSIEDLIRRVTRLERRLRVQVFVLIAVFAIGGVVAFDHLLMQNVIVQQKLMESKELTLLDNDGNPRLFLRMYSKVPVLQIMDSNGKPRMSLGLRFDDTPFIDLSDKTGQTRATFEMNEEDSPALRLFDEKGAPTFQIN